LQDQDQDQDQHGRDQDQDQDLKKVVLIGLETKTMSRDPHPWGYMKLANTDPHGKWPIECGDIQPLGYYQCAAQIHALHYITFRYYTGDIGAA